MMTPTNPAAYVFISYVRNNSLLVGRIVERLRAEGFAVWYDRDDIAVGDQWQAAIRDGIRKGGFFLACFSSAVAARDDTYMHDELRLAAAELQQRQNSRWFVPVRLDDCQLPDLRLGDNLSLTELQWIDLFPDFDTGMQRLIETLAPLRTTPVSGGNDLILQPGNMREKIASAVRLWEKGGRGAAGLLTGRAYFAAQCWVYAERVSEVGSQKYASGIAEFMSACSVFNGGKEGWNALLRELTVCFVCRTSYRLENIGVCAGCIRNYCYECGSEHCCAHSQIVG